MVASVEFAPSPASGVQPVSAHIVIDSNIDDVIEWKAIWESWGVAIGRTIDESTAPGKLRLTWTATLEQSPEVLI